MAIASLDEAVSRHCLHQRLDLTKTGGVKTVSASVVGTDGGLGRDEEGRDAFAFGRVILL